MLSTLTRQENDPHDALEIAPDVVAAARAEKNSPTLAPAVASSPSDPPAHAGSAASAPRVDTTFRATATSNAKANGKRGGASIIWALRAFLLAAVGTAVATPAWQSYGDTAKQMIATWTPYFTQDSSVPAVNVAPPEQPISTASVDQTATPPAPSAQAPVAPAAAVLSPESTQLLQSMARDLAAMGQQIGELKASIEQLRARQEQMSRDIPKTSEFRASEQNLRPRTSTPPQRPAVATVQKPKPPYYPPAQSATVPPLQRAAAPAVSQTIPPAPAPPQAMAQPDGEPVVRPPMPVR